MSKQVETKEMSFTNDQKGMIWSRFVAPTGGTQEEAAHFIEVCEMFGLNPLLNDIVFQRYNTKQGPKTQFITTRDGLLRVATFQPGYVGAPNANVVREGDDFQFIPSNGEVHHKFGQKRGKILGAYAVMRHERFNPVAVFVDFEEYFNANSGVVNSRNKYPNVWDKMPSAMIVKIAEVFVLRRQFPLGGLYTREEMSLENDEFQNGPDEQKVQQNQQQNQQQTPKEPVKEPVQQEPEPTVELISKEQVMDLSLIAEEIAFIADITVEQVEKSLGLKIVEIPSNKLDKMTKRLEYILLKANERSEPEQPEDAIEQKPVEQSKEEVEQEPIKQPEVQTNGQPITLTLIKTEDGISPNETPFLKLFVKEIERPLFAKTSEMINLGKAIDENSSFKTVLIRDGEFLIVDSIENILKSA